MIKRGELVPVPSVRLGRLAKRIETADRSQYPFIRWAAADDDALRIGVDPATPGAYPYTQYDTPEEDLADYADGLRREHADLSDEQMLDAGRSPFNGFGRNQRWNDEMDRREL